VNWHNYLNKDEPFKSIYIPIAFTAWSDRISSFLKFAKSGYSKESYICRFIRHYIILNKLDHSPIDFLIREKTNLQEYRVFLDKLPSDGLKRSIHFTINEFFDYLIRTELTLEDEDTGELAVFKQAKNPFFSMNVEFEDYKNTLDESDKPILAYQYVKSLKQSPCVRIVVVPQIWEI